MKKLSAMELEGIVASHYGQGAARFVGRLLYWIKKNPKERDGRNWTYGSYEYWSEQLCMPAISLKRAVKKLRDDGIIVVGNYNKMRRDRTLWYSVSEESIVSKWYHAEYQGGTMDSIKVIPPLPIPSQSITPIHSDAEGVEESVVDHKPKTAADVVAALKDKKAAVPIIQDTASIKQLKWYWREMLPRTFTDQQLMPPFTLKQEGQFKHLYIRCEGKAGGVLKHLFKDWSGCRSAVEAQTGKTAPTRPDIGWVLANLQVVLNWSQGKSEPVQLVAPPKPSYVSAKQTATTKEKSKPIWLKD